MAVTMVVEMMAAKVETRAAEERAVASSGAASVAPLRGSRCQWPMGRYREKRRGHLD